MRVVQHRRSWSLVALAVAVSLAACSRQTAEEKGQEMATEKIDIVKGVGSALEAKGSAAAESLTGGLGKVVQGAEKGIQKSGRSIEATPSLEQAGLQVTNLQNAGAEGAEPVHGLEVYVVAKKDVQGQLRVVAFNALDQEIGRSRIALKQSADDAGYQTATFDKRVKLTDISKVKLDFQPEAGTQATKP